MAEVIFLTWWINRQHIVEVYKFKFFRDKTRWTAIFCYKMSHFSGL